MVVVKISQAAGSEGASAAISSRMACSERIAKTRPLRVLMVARQNRSNSESRRDRHRFGLAATLLLDQLGDQETHVLRLLALHAAVPHTVIHNSSTPSR